MISIAAQIRHLLSRGVSTSEIAACMCCTGSYVRSVKQRMLGNGKSKADRNYEAKCLANGAGEKIAAIGRAAYGNARSQGYDIPTSQRLAGRARATAKARFGAENESVARAQP